MRDGGSPAASRYSARVPARSRARPFHPAAGDRSRFCPLAITAYARRPAPSARHAGLLAQASRWSASRKRFRTARQPQPHAPPQHPPPNADAPLDGVAPLDGEGATNENRRRTRSLAQDGQASAVSTFAVIERRSSKGRSQARHTYSYVGIASRIPLVGDAPDHAGSGEAAAASSNRRRNGSSSSRWRRPRSSRIARSASSSATDVEIRRRPRSRSVPALDPEAQQLEILERDEGVRTRADPRRHVLQPPGPLAAERERLLRAVARDAPLDDDPLQRVAVVAELVDEPSEQRRESPIGRPTRDPLGELDPGRRAREVVVQVRGEGVTHRRRCRPHVRTRTRARDGRRHRRSRAPGSGHCNAPGPARRRRDNRHVRTSCRAPLSLPRPVPRGLGGKRRVNRAARGRAA